MSFWFTGAKTTFRRVLTPPRFQGKNSSMETFLFLTAFLTSFLNGGLLDFSVGELVVTTLILTHITVVSVTVYFHRFSAHRALELHPALQHFFRFWLWFATGMITKEWTAVHRKHHAKCETEEDPHSPQIQGLNEILWRQTEAYQRSAAQSEVIERYGVGTPDDWLEQNVYTRFSYTGVGVMLALDVFLFGVIGITVWAVQVVWIPVMGGVINGIGHFWGYRNFECPDAARNIVPWGILIGGEELHNNHHTYANSAKLSVKPWEFDMGWLWIRVFQLFGLAKPLSTGPIVVRSTAVSALDANTARALANDRFNVMVQYADRVIAPTIKAHLSTHLSTESQLERGFARRTKQLLCRQDSILSEANRARLQELIEVPEYRRVYELRKELQAIWEQRSGDIEDLVGSLQSWCKAAESTGSEALADFVDELKRYTMPQPIA